MSEKMLVDPQAVKRMVEDEGMTLGTALIFAAVPVPDEITTLCQQLTAAQAENEALRARVKQYETLTDEMDKATRHCYLSGPTVVGQFKRLRQQADEAEQTGGEHG